MTRSQVQLGACDDEHGLSGERTGPGEYFLDGHVQSSTDRPATSVRLPNGSDAFRETVGDILESENDGRLVGVGHYSYLYAASPWKRKTGLQQVSYGLQRSTYTTHLCRYVNDVTLVSVLTMAMRTQ